MTLTLSLSEFYWGCPLPLRDIEGRTRYTLTSDAYALRRCLRAVDLAGREALCIRQQLPSLFPRYELSVYGRPIGAITKAPEDGICRICFSGWSIQGEGNHLEILHRSQVVAACRGTDAHRLELTFHDRTTALTALAILLTVICALNPRTR